MKKTGKIMRIVILLITAALVAGCNIFDFTNDAEKSPVDRAEDAIREGDYALAREVLAEAGQDSTDSILLYLNAKIAILEAEVDIIEIVELIEGQDAKSEDDLAILTLIDDLDNARQTAWYQGNMEAMSNLLKLWNEETTGVILKDDIALDYTISNMMSGVLGLRDTNRDGAIDENDFHIDLSFVESIGSEGLDGFDLNGGSFVDDAGQTVDFKGLEVFLGEWSASKVSASSKVIGKKGYEPDDINDLIAFILSKLENGLGGIRSLLKSDNSSFDADDIKEYIDEIAAIINYYWYHDGIDNDGDGRIDEETINGLDDDGDGLVDEDSGYHPSDPTNTENTQYIDIWLEWSQK
ncbi:hypothetical protein ACFL1R_02595 [Candidatus Latescibacterota bacterium]